MLMTKWIRTWQSPNGQPFEDIKDYYGEKIALYFAWLGHYTTWLCGPAFVGFIAGCFIYSQDSYNPDTQFMPVFALFMAIWTTLFQKYWKRKEKTLSMEWGMVGFEEEERTRPQFKGETIPCPITGRDTTFFDPMARLRRVVVSVLVIFTMISVVVGVTILIQIFQHWAHTPPQDCSLAIGDTSNGCKFGKQTSLGPYIGQLLNSISISTMNALYIQVARMLTTMENHKTNTVYDDQLTAKVFVFEFVNSYGSLFYVAYFKPLADCEKQDCMVELMTSVGVIIVTNLAYGNVEELALPFITRKFAQCLDRSTGHGGRTLSYAEKQYYMVEFGEEVVFDDYAEMIIQFGYATLFAAAFPLAPLLAMMNNFVEIRVDALKICTQYRRPVPFGAEDIGTWYTVLELMAQSAVISNALLVTFTSRKFLTSSVTSVTNTTFNVTTNVTTSQYQTKDEPWSVSAKLLTFVLIEHVVLFIKFFLEFMIGDVPDDVDIQLQRQEFLTSKLIKLEADEKDDELTEGFKRMRTNLTIHSSDFQAEAPPTGANGHAD